MNTTIQFGRAAGPLGMIALATLLGVFTTSLPAPAATLYLTTNANRNIGGLTSVGLGDIIAYTSADPSTVAFDGLVWSDSASIFFLAEDHFRDSNGNVGANYTFSEIKVDPVNKIILFSSDGGGRIGTGANGVFMTTTAGVGNRYESNDIVYYDMNTMSAHLFLDGDTVFRQGNGTLGADAQIDGFSILPNGKILISTRGSEILGSNLLSINDGDVAEYDPITDLATLFFDRDFFRNNAGVAGSIEDIDGLNHIDADNFLLSINGSGNLGANNQSLTDEDIVLYTFGPSHASAIGDAAALWFNGNNFRNGTNQPNGAADIKGFSIAFNFVAVPESSTLALGLLGLVTVGLLALRQRR